MTEKKRSFVLRYGLAVLSFAVPLAVAILQRHSSFKIDIGLLSIVAIIISTWYGGMGPGLLFVVLYEAVKIASYPLPKTSFDFVMAQVNVIGILGILVVLVNGRRKADRRLRQKHEQLQATALEREQLLVREQVARAEAEAANRLKDEFLATVSHELRTPLSSILGWSNLLSRGSLNEAMVRNAHEVIERNAKAQAQIINDILDVSRIITGKLRIELQPNNPASIISAAIDTIRPAAEAKGVTLSAELEIGDKLVRCDPNRLQQIAWNLLINAIKFTPRGGRVEILLKAVDSQVEFTVSDTGKGIGPEFLPYVFERFRQADSSTTRTHGGLGLGLAIVRHLVELHGGTVTATSEGEGRGAAFTVSLPQTLGQPKAALAGQQSTSESRRTGEIRMMAPAVTRLAGVRVLVVDDDMDTLEVLKITLTNYGAEVRTAGSSAEALVILQAWKPDVLVSDIGMPGEDGYKLIQRVRAFSSKEGGSLPAIALTAFAGTEDRRRALEAGYQVHMPKPADLAKLIAAIIELTGELTDQTVHSRN